MPVVHIHNTLTGELSEIKPIAGAAGPVTFYTCGPTVYDDAHIGNFRSFLNADILRRTIELTGTPVRHVMNITDVGHMTDDTDADGGGEFVGGSEWVGCADIVGGLGEAGNVVWGGCVLVDADGAVCLRRTL